MPRSLYAFLYPTVVSKGALEAADLASTHLETNVTHLTPPREPGKPTLQEQVPVQQQLRAFSGTGFCGGSGKGVTAHREELGLQVT